jgi:hypothetical protein
LTATVDQADLAAVDLADPAAVVIVVAIEVVAEAVAAVSAWPPA